MPQWLVKAHAERGSALALDISDEEDLRRLLELNQKRTAATVVRLKNAQQGKTVPRKPDHFGLSRENASFA